MKFIFTFKVRLNVAEQVSDNELGQILSPNSYSHQYPVTLRQVLQSRSQCGVIAIGSQDISVFTLVQLSGSTEQTRNIILFHKISLL